MYIEIKITGGGQATQVAAALRQIALEIGSGDHEGEVKSKGKCEWEDGSLFVTISEEIQ